MTQWGRLLIAGGTDFGVLGRRDRGGKPISTGQPDLPDVHIWRSVANVKFTRIFTSHSGCHAVALDTERQAWVVGRNEQSQLGGPLPEELAPRKPIVSGADVGSAVAPCALEPFPLRALPEEIVPKRLAKQEIAWAACGRHHTILVTTKGEAWAAGSNVVGQCGQNHGDTVATWTRITGALREEHVVMASCGVSFSVLLTQSGRVYTLGSGEHGQLGNGSTGEHIAQARVFFTEMTDPYLVKGALAGKHIVEIATGQQHTIARDAEGVCYAWGFGGFGRLGTEVQKDELVPVEIPYFAERIDKAKHITCGPTSSMFIDQNNIPLLCGKWKTSGDGSSGQPWMFPKPLAELSTTPARRVALGNVTIFVSVADNSDGDHLIAWGQNAAYGELGLGSSAPRSASRPQRVEALDNIGLIDIAAGQSTTFFLAKPPEDDAQPEDDGEIGAIAAAGADADAAPADEASNESPAPAANQLKDETIKELPVLEPGQSFWSLSKIDLSGFGFFAFCPGVRIDPAKIAQYELQKKKERTNSGPVSDVPTATLQAAWEALPRFPAIVKLSDLCVVCNAEKDDTMIECERCEADFHVSCLDPPLTEIPTGEWFCPKCVYETSNARFDAIRAAFKEALANPPPEPAPSAEPSLKITLKRPSEAPTPDEEDPKRQKVD